MSFQLVSQIVLGLAERPLLLLSMLGLLGLSVGFFIAWRQKTKVWLLHAHLALFIAPFFLLAYALNCSLSLMQGLLAFCATIITKLLLVVIPLSVVLAFLLGYYIMPWLVRKSLVARQTLQFSNILPAHVRTWIIDKAKPVAFSTQNHIFLSVGILELLSPKQIEAVVLHELNHVLHKNSWTKVSAALAYWVSPLAHFSTQHSSADEHRADCFAATTQGSWRHVCLARKKVQECASKW